MWSIQPFYLAWTLKLYCSFFTWGMIIVLPLFPFLYSKLMKEFLPSVLINSNNIKSSWLSGTLFSPPNSFDKNRVSTNGSFLRVSIILWSSSSWIKCSHAANTTEAALGDCLCPCSYSPREPRMFVRQVLFTPLTGLPMEMYHGSEFAWEQKKVLSV